MTVIQPVNILKAYRILISLPSGMTREEILEFIVERFKLSKTTAKIYLRALKSWGFLKGEKEIYAEKTKLESFIHRLRELIFDELGDDFISALKSAINMLPSSSIEGIALILKTHGFDISLWKLKNIIRILKQTNLLSRKYLYEFLEMGASLSDIAYNMIVARGRYQLNKFLEIFTSNLSLDRCEAKKIVVQLVQHKRIMLSAPRTLVDLWIEAIQEGICDVLKIHKDRLEEDVGLDELRNLSAEHPDIVSIEGDFIIIRILEGDFLMVPVYPHSELKSS